MDRTKLLLSFRKNRVLFFVLIFLAELILVTSLDNVVFASGCQQLYDGVLRLHILANSDSKEDQELKIKVRDRVLVEADKLGLGAGCRDMEALCSQAEEVLPELEKAAQQEVYRNGRSDKVTAQIVTMYFDTREYENFTMPAGEYRAVRFVIGSGKGKNWWCVLFPQLCLPTAFAEEKEEDVFSSQELRVLTSRPQYEPRFALLETFYHFWKKD